MLILILVIHNKKSVKLDCFPLFKVFGVTCNLDEIVQLTHRVSTLTKSQRLQSVKIAKF